MTLQVGTNAGGDGECTGGITTKTIFDCPTNPADKVYFDILYTCPNCCSVPTENGNVSIKNTDGTYTKLFDLVPVSSYGYVYWKNNWISGKCGNDFKAEYGGDSVNFHINAAPTHRECRDGYCCEIAGTGTNTCTTSHAGYTCSLASECSHNECSNGECIQINSPGTSTCTGTGEGTCFHNECQNNACTKVNTLGTSTCTIGGNECTITKPIDIDWMQYIPYVIILIGLIIVYWIYFRKL